MKLYEFFENLVNPYPETDIKALPKNFWAFLWSASEGLRRHMLLLTLFTLVIGAFEASLFAVLGKVVDWLSAIDPAQLWVQESSRLLLLAGFILSSVLVVLVHSLLKYQSVMGNLPMRLRWNFHRLLLNQSMSFYQEEFAGRIATKVMQTALAARDVLISLCEILVYIGIYFVTIIVLVAAFSAWLLLPFLLWFALYSVALFIFVPRLMQVARNQADSRSLMTGRVTDAYTNISTVKLFSHAGRESAYVRSSMQEFLLTVHRQMRLVSYIEITIHSLNMLLVLGASAMALWLWVQGNIGVGSLAAAIAVTLRLNGMSHWLIWELAALFENIGTVQDGINLLSRASVVQDHAEATILSVPRGEIVFEDVRFSYGAVAQSALIPAAVIDGINLRIRPGEKIGLVGRSGAGKSTLVNLLLRFYDIDQGRILIDGQDIAQVTQESLRAKIGMVTQDSALLHRSVRDNIAYGLPEATDDEVHDAACRAAADVFIARLEDQQGCYGYDAQVGERGVKLSGGQRQRVAIARVMLKNAPILLLDEATSALDSEVEVAIQDSLYQLMEGKTVMAIAHRLSTIAAMDRLIVLDEGKIIEEGTHESLLAKNGVYARLWAHQSGSFLGEEP